VTGHLRVERRIAQREHLAEGHVPHAERATREVDRDLHERLVEGEEPGGEAGDAGLVPQRLPEGLAEHDAGVLDRVMAIDVEIALGLHREVEAAVAPELVEHVVEERQAGRDVDDAGAAVEVDRHVDRRLPRGA
jgi:hypothetical protein